MEKHNKSKYGSEKKFFISSESATATVIGAVLLLGIIFSIITILYVEYIPEWKGDAEYSHMDDICADMAEVKSKIDMMSIILALNQNCTYSNSLNPSTSDPQIVMSVPFHMGGGSLPLVGTIKSSGTLAVNKENCTISIVASRNGSSNYSQLTSNHAKLINCGTITYNSQNNYYVDQVFSYENGALILDQTQTTGQKDQSVMMLYPSVRFSKAFDNDSAGTKYNVSINNIKLSQPYAPSKSISSNRGCSLRLIGTNYIPSYDSNIAGDNLTKLELTVWTEHPAAWRQYFQKVTMDADIGPNDYDLSPPESSFVRFTFPSQEKPSTKGLKGLYVSETVIKAEPGIGLS